MADKKKKAASSRRPSKDSAYEDHGVFFVGKKKQEKSEPAAESSSASASKRASSKDGAERSLDPTQMYMREIGYVPLLSKEEERALAMRVQEGDSEARKKMIESNLRLVVKIARYYCNRGLAFLDLIEEGNLGLMHAVKKFDPERGFRFSTYATWWVRQTIERAIMNQSRSVRLPVHVIKELNVYLRAAKKLSQQLDHEPTAEEIGEMVDKPLEEIQRVMNLTADTTSIHTPINGEGDRSLGDIIADTSNVDPTDVVQESNLKACVLRWMDLLAPREREVIMRRYGLGEHVPATLEIVGESVGLTRERVRQIQVAAIKKLKQIINGEGIKLHDMDMQD